MSNNEMSAQPTIETVLALIDEWGARTASECAEIKAVNEELRKGYEELRKGYEDLGKGYKQLRKDQEVIQAQFIHDVRRAKARSKFPSQHT